MALTAPGTVQHGPVQHRARNGTGYGTGSDSDRVKMSISNPKDGHEIEVKLRLDGIEQLHRAGLTLEIEAERHFEDNWLFDTPDGRLGRELSVLRVRIAGTGGSMTYKAKADDEVSRFKRRIEIETRLDDPRSAIALFERLGYRKWFRYQKYRTVYRAYFDPDRRLSVMFDETPIGNFVELEGGEDDLAAAVALLGVDPADFILESYLTLQANACAARGRSLEDMIFEVLENR